VSDRNRIVESHNADVLPDNAFVLSNNACVSANNAFALADNRNGGDRYVSARVANTGAHF
jgi:hypothetical protein